MTSAIVCDKPYTNGDKWTASVISGLSFLAVSSPYTYSVTNDIANSVSLKFQEKSGCPTVAGMIAHSLVYTFLIRMMMEKKGMTGCRNPYTSKDKWISSAIGGVMFLVVSSPILYKTVNSLTSQIGITVSDSKGCPTAEGLLIHSGVFTLLTRLMMH